jgi:serine phosphatase RsbU (regulator of sigma subunit)
MELADELKAAQEQSQKIALALQRPMLFQPKEDAFSGLMVHTAYAMASEEALVGGDFWDTFAYDHGHVAFVLGDVTGHGLPSAIFTTELKHTMRAYIREHEEPARILYHMNQFLFQSTDCSKKGSTRRATMLLSASPSRLWAGKPAREPWRSREWSRRFWCGQTGRRNQR